VPGGLKAYATTKLAAISQDSGFVDPERSLADEAVPVDVTYFRVSIPRHILFERKQKSLLLTTTLFSGEKPLGWPPDLGELIWRH
jgi:hypothetical protein